MPSATVENYLKHIYHLQEEAEGGLVAMGKLTAAVGVTPGTGTTMVKALAESGLADYEPRGGVRLTVAGGKLAQQVLRRHRLIELFLVEVLGMDWAEVHDEAEELEHAISDKVLERLDVLLGHPQTDPHGDPIPPADHHERDDPPGRTDGPRWTLADCPTDQPLCVSRVLDQGPAFLQYLDHHGLIPGAAVVVGERFEASDAVTVHLEGRQTVTLGTVAAAKVAVASVDESRA